MSEKSTKKNAIPDIQPVCAFGEPNKETTLATASASITVKNAAHTGNAEVIFTLLPRASVQLRIKFNQMILGILDPLDATQTVSFGPYNVQIQGFAVSSTYTSSNGTVLTWQPRREPVQAKGDSNTLMSRVTFHLFNFRDFVGAQRTSELIGNTSYAIEHLSLNDGIWRIHIHSLASTREHIRIVEKAGGYTLTHVGMIERIDGVSFSGADADGLLLALRFFLSFGHGQWCNPVCPVGFDAQGNRQWEQWSSPGQPWYSTNSWFNSHKTCQLEGLFPGFMKKWRDEDWQTAFKDVMYWYLNSNQSSRGIDAGIILTQTAIERLSYEFAVKEKGLVETEGFKGLKASDKFRLLFASLDIPTVIPSQLVELEKYGKQFNWTDAPHALTEIRNSLVHPEHKRRGQFDAAYYEAWNLGLWFLELCLLRLCGYNGTFSNRITSPFVGVVEDVPWSSKGASDPVVRTT